MNRITTPDGVRLILDHVVGYTTWDDDDEMRLTIFFGYKTDDTIVFNNSTERDAFIARLDAYFEEIQ